jgi:hypothetical protein
MMVWSVQPACFLSDIAHLQRGWMMVFVDIIIKGNRALWGWSRRALLTLGIWSSSIVKLTAWPPRTSGGGTPTRSSGTPCCSTWSACTVGTWRTAA